jgi:hypothetical protein
LFAAGPDYQGDQVPEGDEATDVCDEIDGLLEQIEVGEGQFFPHYHCLLYVRCQPDVIIGGKKGYVNLNFA